MSDDPGRASPDSESKESGTHAPATLVAAAVSQSDLQPRVAEVEETGIVELKPLIATDRSISSTSHSKPKPLNSTSGISISGEQKNVAKTVGAPTVCPHCRKCISPEDATEATHASMRIQPTETYTNSQRNGAQAINQYRSGRLTSHLVTGSSGESWGSSYWSVLDLMLGTSEGQWCSLILLGVLLIASGTIAWVAIGGNEEVPAEIWGSLWFSWYLFIDPGTHTGIEPTEPFKIKFVGAVFSVLGFIFNLCLLGLIVDQVRDKLQVWKEIRNRTVLNGHTIILGWGPRTLFILNELLRAYDAEVKYGHVACRCCRRRRRVLIMADEDLLVMQRETRLHLASASPPISWRGIYFRRGDPTDWIQLRKTSPNSAADVIVMGKASGRPSDSDQHVLQILLALAALPKAFGVQGEVVAEMRTMENVAVAKNVLNYAAVIEPRYAANRMLCLSGLLPAIGSFMDDLVSFQHGDVLFLTPVPPSLHYQTFQQASRALGSAVLIGVKKLKEKHALAGNAEELHDVAELAPEWDYKLQPEDILVSLAENRLDASSVRATANVDTAEPLAASTELRDAAMSNKEVSSLEDNRLKCVCMIGCPSDFSEFVDLMGSFCSDGSEVHILSEKDLAWRERCMKMSFSTDRSLKQWGNSTPFSENIDHIVGPTTSLRHLEDLPLERASCVFVLAEKADEEDANSVDSRSLNTMITLRHMLRDPLPEDCTVVCELIDPRSEYIVTNNDNLKDLGRYFHSNRIETALISMCAEGRAVFNALQTLLEFTNEIDVIAIPVGSILRKDSEDLSFMGLQSRLLEDFGGILIGWHRHPSKPTFSLNAPTDEDDEDPWKPDINPPDKVKKLKWKSDSRDVLIVIRREPVEQQPKTCGDTSDDRTLGFQLGLPGTPI